ncbi:glycosyl transferase [Weizmannia acidilactici]|uniref:4,4'-diaponeurosporenoate glycosyltransferase n=1 Tax=Weizmannia acidilactici TaxID=2607726 RepID=A0A5J4JHE3_9BACI|nr:glycosyltransferase [Weizmannia acidilactici]GER70105.1 glycosyl transferase [Weizmannia acidilactici]
MPAIFSFLILFGLLSGMVLFRKNSVPQKSGKRYSHETISVIIPARNEEKHLPPLLESLWRQTVKPDEIIVVDDHSEDQTKEIAERCGAAVFFAPDLPESWTGKTWAVWNGYLRSSGDFLVFLDADIRLAENAIVSLIAEQKRQGGVISVVPYHHTEKFHEKFAMILNLLGIFAFTSPFERKNRQKGLYGACIVATRKDYEKIGGHQSIHAEMLDDLNLGARFQNAGIRVTNLIGSGLVSFRMYPDGIKSELEGFAKGAVLSTSAIHSFTLAAIILWILGLLLSELCFFLIGTPGFFPLCAGYLLYAAQIYFFNRHAGNFGILHPVCHFLSTIFSLIVVGYSLYQAVFRKKVVWKGRYIHVGRGHK